VTSGSNASTKRGKSGPTEVRPASATSATSAGWSLLRMVPWRLSAGGRTDTRSRT
jgi:hypothetical protein